MKQSIWLLADDRIGNVNQLLGVAEALESPFEQKNISYTKWIKLPNFIRRASLVGLTDRSKQELKQKEFPDIVLSAGRRSFPIALWIKKKSGNKTKIIQLMNPGATGFNKADLIVLPEHDLYTRLKPNVMTVTGTAHRITSKRLKQEKEKWDKKFKNYPHPRLSLIIGGATKNKPFTLEMAVQLVKAIRELQPQSLLVTTSRRTPENITVYLKKELKSKTTYFYQFGDKSENPYFGLIACADIIVVTGDSMSMCSECCSTCVPVFIFAPSAMMSKKHKRFHQSLYTSGYALPLGTDLKPVRGSFNPAKQIAKKIKTLFSNEI